MNKSTVIIIMVSCSGLVQAEEKPAADAAQPLATFGGFIIDLALLSNPSIPAATVKGEPKFTLTQLTNTDDV